MDNPQIYSGWGPEASGDLVTYYDEGTAVKTVYYGDSGTADITCRVIRFSDGVEDVTSYLAQDTTGDVYLIRIIGDVTRDGVIDDVVPPMDPSGCDLFLYMPATISGPMVIDSITTLGYTLTREIVALDATVDLVTGWGDGTYANNVVVRSVAENGSTGDVDSGYEYYQPGVGLIRVTDDAGDDGYDRGEIPPTPTPMPTATPTQVPAPVITDIFRDKSIHPVSGDVEVTFTSVAGVTYDIYTSGIFDPATWFVQGSILATGPSTTYVDTSGVLTERYYRIGVQGSSPTICSPNEAGNLPVMVMGRSEEEPSQLALLGIPLGSTDSLLQLSIGWQMTGGWTADTADEIWIWNTATMGYQRNWLFDSAGIYPAYDGTWFDLGSGSPSNAGLPLGQGFWARSKQTSVQTIQLDGIVPRSETVLGVHVAASMMSPHIFGQPFPKDVPLDEASTSFIADGAKGDWTSDSSDEIWFWEQISHGYQRNWLFDSAGYYPAYDGTWFDLSTGLPTDVFLARGRGFWYRAKADASRVGTPSWLWTQPVPY